MGRIIIQRQMPVVKWWREIFFKSPEVCSVTKGTPPALGDRRALLDTDTDKSSHTR